MNITLMVVLVLAMGAAVCVALWAVIALMKARTELASRLSGDAALERIRREAVEAQLKGLENRFASLAASQLADRQRDLVGLNSKNISELFSGLKERLQKYESEVEAAKAETKDSALKMAENVRELQRFATVAQNYTSALLGGNKIQGNKGEEILSAILEQSGLQNGLNYETQVGKKDEEGRPDVCIFDAMNKRSIFVDAKMNIKDFIDAYNQPEDTQEAKKLKKAALAKHVTSIRKQIKQLGERDYPKVIASPREGYENLPLVAMFCPFNAVLEAALLEDPTLMQFAFENNVVLVTPLTLWGYLWLISYGWKKAEVEKKIEEIQALGGEVAAKIDELLQDIDTVEKSLTNAFDACGKLKKRAGDKGQLSIRRVADQLLNYGATPSRQLKRVGKVDLVEADAEEGR